MKFSATAVFSLLAALASAQNPNSFNIPAAGYSLTAGQPATFSWSNPTGTTVTLLLRSGPSNNLVTAATIASGVANTGSITFTVPADIVQGSTYAVEIIDDQDNSIVNYTPQFPIASTNTGTTTSASSSAGPTTSASSGSSSYSASSSSASSSYVSSSGSASSSSYCPSSTSTVTYVSSSAASTYVSSVYTSLTSSAAPYSNTTIPSTLTTAAVTVTASGGSIPTSVSGGSATTSAPFTVATGAAARPMVAGAGLLAAVAAVVAAF